MRIDRTKVVKNVYTGFGGQAVIIILGIIIPRFMIKSYGSDVNGLLSTIGQIFTYMAMLEAGIARAAKNLLYKPIINQDKDSISHIISIAATYYKRVAIYYGIGVLILAFIAPFIIRTAVDSKTVFLVVLFEGMSGAITFYHVSVANTLLAVDGKGYINNGVTVVNKMLSYAVKLFLASLGINIIILQIVFFFVTIIKIVFYKLYLNKNYSWVNFHASQSHEKLKDRNSFIITEIAWTLFSSTDMIVLSIMINTQAASVYSVYNMIFLHINTLMSTVYNSTNYVLGQAYQDNIETYSKIHDSFNSIFLGIMTILMSVSFMLCIPFVTLYTSDIADVNYIIPVLPMLFCLVQLLEWSRKVGSDLVGLAGYAKQLSYVSLVESAVNIVLSFILVHWFGLVGVLVATVVALPVKVIYCAYLSDCTIMKRSIRKSIKIIGVNFLTFGCLCLLWKLIRISINSYLKFACIGILLTIVCTLIIIPINIAVNPQMIHMKLSKRLK